MNDDSSQSRSPRENGASSQTDSRTFGDAVRAWLRSLTGPSESDLRESLEEVIEEHGNEDDALDPGQRQMLFNILKFGELKVDDVMVPRADIVAIEFSTPLKSLLETFRDARHSRLPVFRQNLDEVTGFIHIKDIVDFWDNPEEFTVEKILRQPLVVPPSMLVVDVLARMRATRRHMAIVVDEYGGVDGLVTIEDVVEEIVGEIADEHDPAETPVIVESDDGTIDADARTEIELFESRFGVDLASKEIDEDVDTLGGLVISMLGRVPRPGEKLEHPAGLEFEVVEADPRRIKRLKIRRAPAQAAGRSG